MKLIVGLGNIGDEYKNTYHNIGFDFVDYLARKNSFPPFKTLKHSLVSRGKIDSVDVLLAKPTTYMNNSGIAVEELRAYYKLDNAVICIALDDIDLDLGASRFREGGSAGTHNGLRSIVNYVGSTPRIRIGAGRNEKMDLADYVLSKVNPDARKLIDDAIEGAVEKLKQFLEN